MPSQRPATLNPRVAAPLPAAGVAPPAVSASRVSEGAMTVKRGAKNAAGKPAPTGLETGADSRAGGFHESSYELQNGLQITESEWPDDVTVPGSLGDR